MDPKGTYYIISNGIAQILKAGPFFIIVFETWNKRTVVCNFIVKNTRLLLFHGITSIATWET